MASGGNELWARWPLTQVVPIRLLTCLIFFALLDVISLSTIGERIGAGFDTSLSELYVVISTKSVRKICIDGELFPETCPVVLV